MIGGSMCCGVHGDELIVRLDPNDEDEALTRPHARPMDLTGRRMRGFITVHPDGLKGNRLNRCAPGEPGPRAGRAEPGPAEDLLHGGGGDCDAEAVQFADDPLVGPARILVREAQHQLVDLPADRRPAVSTTVGPAGRDQP
jgi:hypothetical protein